jgi:hypothetical protein
MMRHLRTTEPTGRARARSEAGSAIVASIALLACSSLPALAVDPAQPERVWGGCVLDPATVENIQIDVNEGIGADLDTDIQVAFVVVYSLNDNDGQGPVSLGPTTGFTGPILCTNPAEVGTPIEVTESQDIPTQTGPSGATSIDILDVEEAMILRYEVNGGSAGGAIEKRFCHTTGVNNDCFRIPGTP